MITVQDLSLRFGDRVLFDEIRLSFRDGGKYGLLGRNGSGKTTLLKVLTGELSPDEGAIDIPGGYTLGYLKQQLDLDPSNTVRENAALAFEEINLVENQLRQLSRELESREDYESDAYGELIQRLSDLNDRLDYLGPAWVGLTVLFVMHSDGATELRRIRDRALGTVVGVIAAAPLVFYISSPLPLAACVFCAALFIPYAQRGHYMLFSFIITLIVLLLIDMATLRMGGDISLLRWRLLDTILACGGVLISNLILRLIASRLNRNKKLENTV